MVKVKLTDNVAVYSVSDQVICFVSETTGIKSFPAIFKPELMALLTGDYSAFEIAEKLKTVLAPSKTMLLLDILHKEGLLSDVNEKPSETERRSSKNASFYRLDGGVKIQYLNIAHDTTHPQERMLREMGMIHVPDAPLTVVFTDDYLREGLKEINQENLSHGQPWLLAKIVGKEPWVGPFFAPGQGPCWECLASRLRYRSRIRLYLAKVNGDANIVIPPLHSEKAVMAAAASWVFAIVNQYQAGSPVHAYSDTVWTLDTTEGSGWQSHKLIRRPQCKACGNPSEAMPPDVIRLQEGLKSFHDDGGHRMVEPLLTWDRLKSHISPITGVVDRIESIHFDEYNIGYMSSIWDAAPINDVKDLVKSRYRNGYGKGITHTQARVSCLAEALEHYTFMQERPIDAIHASMNELGEDAVDPNKILLFSDDQYEKRTLRDESMIPFEWVPPNRFDPDETIGWTYGWSLTRNKTRLVPSDMCWMTDSETRDSDFCLPDSNGCAAGNCLEEAILQGLYEVIERDAVAIWWYNRIRRPSLALESFADKAVTDILEHHKSKLDRALHVLDLTTDIGIPVFAAISSLMEGEYPETVFSFGCHLDPRIALRRAVTEMCQCMGWWRNLLTTRANPTPWDGTRRFISPGIEKWLRRMSREEQDFMSPLARRAKRTPADFSVKGFPDFADEIRWCIERLSEKGIEVIVIDATRPDLNLSMVKVFAPGLRHFWRRLAPGRLYDVPVSLGWLDRPRTETEMNPVTHFL